MAESPSLSGMLTAFQSAHVPAASSGGGGGSGASTLAPLCTPSRAMAGKPSTVTPCRAFQNARALAADGGGVDGRGVSTLVPLLRRAAAACAAAGTPGSDGSTKQEAAAELAAPLCGALRALAVNDDICKVILAKLRINSNA